MSTPAPMLRIPEVARRLDLSESTVYAMCAAGTIPAIKLGGSWRVHATRLEQMLESVPSDHRRAA